MTDCEKMMAMRMKQRGMGYKNIASQLGLSINTVKSFLRRSEKGWSTACENCGTAIVQAPHRKLKRFCSDSCRMQWWNSHRDQVQKRTTIKVTCGNCGKEFESYEKQKRVYCSRECYDATRRGKAETAR